MKVGEDSSGTQHYVTTNTSGNIVIAPLAHERDIGTSNAHGMFVPQWNMTPFNPRAASTGSTKGAAGAVGTTEVLIGAGVPVTFGGVIFEDDSTANEDILLRNAAATGTSAAAQSVGSGVVNVGANFSNGLCVCGTAVGVSAMVLWRVTGANS